MAPVRKPGKLSRVRPRLARLLWPALLALCATAAPRDSAAQPAASASAQSAASASASAASSAAPVAEVPLPEIPPLTPIPSNPPGQEAVNELSLRLDQLANLDEISGPLDDSIDWSFLTSEVDEALILAIAQRLDELKEQIEGDDAVRLLKKARAAGRKAIRKRKRNNKGKGKQDDEGDWLTFVMALDDHDSQTWRDVAQLYGMLRMLEAARHPHAVRVMVGSYSSFGELVRIDLQRALARLKDIAVPALLEAKKHDARKVRSWARRQLDSLGKAIPGEAVSTTDPMVLAAVLRSFGRIRDNDATRIILSFANSDRSELRKAAREAIGAMGEPATWHLKDTYKTLTDSKPPRAWDHVRTARELFRLYDRARLAEVYAALDRGTKAAKEKRHTDAIAAFDAVLARAPLIAGRETMAASYEARAEELLAEDKLEPALAMARKALRLAAPDADTSKLRARLYYMEGKQLVDAGTPDPLILKRAIELDPSFAPPKQLLDSLQHKAEERQTINKRYVAAGVIGALGLAGMVVIARRRPREEDTGSPASPEAAIAAPEPSETPDTAADPIATDEQ